MRWPLLRAPSFFERRRARRADARPRENSYTYELAVLHLQLLVAMSAADGEVDSAEVETALGFLDRTSLQRDDAARLQAVALSLIHTPPQLDALLGSLAQFASRPSLARSLVTDLARVASTDSHAHPREVALLDAVCDAVGVDRIALRVRPPEIGTCAAPGPRRPLPNVDRVAQQRLRDGVRRALEASYADDVDRAAG